VWRFLLLLCWIYFLCLYLELFSFFSVHDSQVWSFDGVTEILNIPFTDLQSILWIFFHFSLISILSLSSEILYPACWNGFQLYFIFDFRKFFPGFLCDSFFFETVHIFVKLLFHILYCFLYFTYLQFYNFLHFI
jgi:hypothetical protein